MKTIVLLGYYESFDYQHVGGTDSYLRRLIRNILKDSSFNILFVLYGSHNKENIEINSRYKIIYVENFKKSLKKIKKVLPTHVISIWIEPLNRLRYGFFKYNLKSAKFHSFQFFYPNTFIQKVTKILELSFIRNNGWHFCVSFRQLDFFSKFAHRTKLLLPSVPDSYFVDYINKKTANKIRIKFLGRIDARKGIIEVINLFKLLKNNDIFECEIYGISIPEDKEAYEISLWLQNQSEISYVEVDRQKYTPKIDEMVQRVLENTDIFIQPYRSLDSTVDTPLLILEAMASSCAILTRPIGNIVEIYGRSKFVIDGENFVKNALNVLENDIINSVNIERMRIHERCEKIGFKSSRLSSEFLKALEK